MPDVLEVINVPGLRNFSTSSKINFLISSLSTTTSIVQSQPAISFILSSKLPVVIFLITSFVKTGEGLDFIAVAKASFTIRFLTADLSSVNPFFISASVNSLGGMSNNNTCKPAPAKWQAIRLPITPLPNIATFFIVLFCIVLN